MQCLILYENTLGSGALSYTPGAKVPVLRLVSGKQPGQMLLCLGLLHTTFCVSQPNFGGTPRS